MDSENNLDSIGSIAIIGMSGRFPGAKNLDEFWQNLEEGVESISFFSEQELVDAGISPTVLNQPNYVKAGAVLEDVELFDASFFGFNNREAALMDPQQRILMECAWEALESAGYPPETYDGKIGVYAGSIMNNYLLSNLDEYVDSTISTERFQALLGNDKDYLATRLSYKLNLKGPSLAVQTACSTSLVAVCQACQSLLNYQCDLALAGGVAIRLPLKAGYLSEKGSIFSPDGHCRTFDAQAQGTIFGNGVGIVALKRLGEAITDGDDIQAVIKGFAINNDGALKVGYTAPGLDGQTEVIAMAQALAEVEPETITYTEAHGTGTPIGDPIEVAALTQVFRASTEKKGFCAIGSVKTNIGHLEAAAGIASLLKTVLALKHKLIPPSVNFKTPNPQIDFANSPFYVNTKLSEWQTNGFPRRAGVSSFGMGGTNAHIVLEEAPKLTPRRVEVECPVHILGLSAKSDKALRELAQKFERYLSANPSQSLGNICFTANAGRTHFPHRLAVVAESPEKMQTQLAAFTKGQKTTGLFTQDVLSSHQPKIAFLFTGQGSQYVGMGGQLYDTQPTFRKILHRCDQILQPYLKQSLLSLLYPEPGLTSPLNETAYTQPALFALEYAIAELLQSWGIKPSVVMGHSLGEYVAACVAGVFSLEDGLKLVAERGRLMQSLPQDGEMTVVFASEAQVLEVIQPYAQDVAIAAVNGPQNIVISGKRQAINEVGTILLAQGIKTKNLNVSHGFHSALIEPIVEAFKQIAEQIPYSCPRLDIISNLTGETIEEKIATPEYWCDHIRESVKFAPGMKALEQQNCEVFLEIGPQPNLLVMGRQCLPKEIGVWLPTLRQGRSDWQQLLQSLAELYVRGVKVDWLGFERDYPRYRLQLPTYPWQRKRYWLEKVHKKLLDKQEQVQRLWESAVSAGRYQSQHGPLDLVLHTYSAKQESMERLIIAYMTEALSSLGAYTEPGERHSLKDLLHHCQISSTYEKLLLLWLKQLAGTGILKQENKEVFVSERGLPKFSLDSLINEAQEHFTDVPFLLDYLQRCGSQLVSILTGKQTPLETLFPSGSLDIAEKLYEKWAVARYFNDIVRSVTESVVKFLQPRKQLRILEVGAGTGGTTASVLPVLPPEQTIYYFTDISDFFLVLAQEKFKAYPFVRYSLLNIEQEPQKFGYEEQSFDVILATNVLHATSNLEETLDHVRSLLAPGGLLILNELTRHTFWLEISMGLLEGWQRFDDSLRQGNPLLSAKKWEELLREHGFEKVIAFPEAGSVTEILGQHILVAQVPMSAEDLKDSEHFSIAAQNDFSETEEELFKLHNVGKTPEPSLTREILLAAPLEERLPLVTAYLREQVARSLGVFPSELSLEDPLKELGIDSLIGVVLKNRLEMELKAVTLEANFLQDISLNQLGLQVLEQLITTSSISGTAETLSVAPKLKHSQPQSKSLIAIKSNGSKLPFVCVHPGGLDVSGYANLAHYLSDEQPFYVLQPPELDNYLILNDEQLPPTTIEDIAARCVEVLYSLQSQGPYLLGGWSLGGCVAFEIAQQLHQQGHKVALLALLDVTNIVSSPLEKDYALIPGFASYLGARHNQELSVSYNELKEFNLNEQLKYVLKQSVKAGIVPQNTTISEIREFFKIYQTGTQTSLGRVGNYKPQIYPDKITLFQASEVLDGLSETANNSMANWSKFSTKSPELHLVSGNHYTMLVKPHVKVLAQKLSSCLVQLNIDTK